MVEAANIVSNRFGLTYVSCGIEQSNKNSYMLIFPGSLDPEKDTIYICPTCEKAPLKVVEGSLFNTETLTSRDHSDPDWEPDWIEGVFSCHLACTSSTCQESVSCCGRSNFHHSIHFDYETGDEEIIEDWIYTPTLFEPPLKIFPVPRNVDQSLRDALNESFRVFFASPGAAANLARIAVELLLDAYRVPRETDNDRGQKNRRSLHWRIENAATYSAELADFVPMLLATKWIGNAGSHECLAAKHEDVRAMYELISYVLDELYLNRRARLAALAARINNDRGISPARD